VQHILSHSIQSTIL